MNKFLVTKIFLLFALVMAVSFFTTVDANANTFENHLHVWYDSQGKYKYHGGMSDGDEDTATHKILRCFTILKIVTESNIHSMYPQLK